MLYILIKNQKKNQLTKFKNFDFSQNSQFFQYVLKNHTIYSIIIRSDKIFFIIAMISF